MSDSESSATSKSSGTDSEDSSTTDTESRSSKSSESHSPKTKTKQIQSIEHPAEAKNQDNSNSELNKHPDETVQKEDKINNEEKSYERNLEKQNEKHEINTEREKLEENSEKSNFEKSEVDSSSRKLESRDENEDNGKKQKDNGNEFEQSNAVQNTKSDQMECKNNDNNKELEIVQKSNEGEQKEVVKQQEEQSTRKIEKEHSKDRRKSGEKNQEQSKVRQRSKEINQELSKNRRRSKEKSQERSKNRRSKEKSQERSKDHHKNEERSHQKSKTRYKESEYSGDHQHHKNGDKSRESRKRYDKEHEYRKDSKRRSRSRSVQKLDKDKSSPSKEKSNEENTTEKLEKPPQVITERQRRTVDLLTSRTGGAYIPPAKLRMLQAEITDKSSAAYQRIAWEALKKSIHGYINKVNVDNIGIITRELLKENIIRGRGLLCRSIIQAQAASPTFTHVYAALVAIINTKFPNIGELLLKRLVIQFKRGFRRNDKNLCISSCRFIAHLVNQRVVHEILALEILTLLVETPTDDSVEVAIAFLKECGMKLTEVSSKGVNAIFEMLKNILHEGQLDKRVQYMIEVVFQVRKDGFKDHQSVIEALDLVEEDDQFTHLIMLDEATDAQDILNVFKFDDNYETNEDKYKGLSKQLLGSDASDSESGSSGSGSSDGDDDEDDDDEKDKSNVIIDNTETNLVALRRTIYLTIHSSLDYEECAHKLMKMQLKPGQEMELCHMFLDCCAEQRTYEKFYGLLAQRFCTINNVYVQPFEEIFKDTYHTTHRLDTNRLRNVSKFFAHLLFTDAIGWDVLECIKLNEDDTTSSSRIFIKILFQELAEYMGLSKLNERLKDVTLAESYSGLFPRDNPKNTRFAINFFTSIGLGGLTDELREFLKSAPKTIPNVGTKELITTEATSSSSSSSSSSDSSSSSSSSTSSSSSSTSSSSSSSDSDNNHKTSRKRKKERQIKKVKDRNKRSRKSTKNKHSDSSEEENKSPKKSSKKHKKKENTKKEGKSNKVKVNDELKKKIATEKSHRIKDIEDENHKRKHDNSSEKIRRDYERKRGCEAESSRHDSKKKRR